MFSSKDAVAPNTAAAPSLISRDVVITGILHSEGDIQIEGRIDGHVRARALVIGDEASIQGEILADSVTVRGKVDGTIRARRVALAAGCHVEGDIRHETLEVEFGAFIQGHIAYAADPMAESVPAVTDQSVETDRRRAGSPMRGEVSGQGPIEEPQRIAATG